MPFLICSARASHNDATKDIAPLVMWLRAKGYDHAVANDRLEALARLKAEHFDLVVFAHEFRPQALPPSSPPPA